MSTVSHGLKQLADTIEALENSGRPVTDINTDTAELESGDGLMAEFAVKIPLPFSGDNADEGKSVFSATAAEIQEDGAVQVSFEGQITDEVVQSVQSTSPVKQHSQGMGRRVPPHRDPDALQEAYEQCDTFVEMKRELGTDVTPEAVRQQMVKHGIHEVPDESGPQITEEHKQETKATEEDEPARATESTEETETARATAVDESETTETTDETTERLPETSDKAGEDGSVDSSTESPSMPDGSVETDSAQPTEVVISDGGIEANLTVEELKEVVQSSQTLYEATQKLRVDREEAREMLKRLNLLDLVTGRLSTKGDRDVTSEEISRRIRASNLPTA